MKPKRKSEKSFRAGIMTCMGFQISLFPKLRLNPIFSVKAKSLEAVREGRRKLLKSLKPKG